MLNQLVGSPISLHGDLSCVAYFLSRWRPKVERVDYQKTPVSETEKKPVTFRSCGRNFRQLLREWKLVDKRLVAVFFLFDTPHDFRAISAG
jgi:hypothetical protein